MKAARKILIPKIACRSTQEAKERGMTNTATQIILISSLSLDTKASKEFQAVSFSMG